MGQAEITRGGGEEAWWCSSSAQYQYCHFVARKGGRWSLVAACCLLLAACYFTNCMRIGLSVMLQKTCTTTATWNPPKAEGTGLALGFSRAIGPLPSSHLLLYTHTHTHTLSLSLSLSLTLLDFIWGAVGLVARACVKRYDILTHTPSLSFHSDSQGFTNRYTASGTSFSFSLSVLCALLLISLSFSSLVFGH